MSDERKWIASDGVSELRPGMLVLVRDGEKCHWTVSVFSHYISGNYPYVAVNRPFVHCIPLEGNEHMAGTTLPIPMKEKPFEWGEKVLVWNKEGEEKTLAIFLTDGGVGYEYRYDVVCIGHHRESSWKNCARAPLDAAAEQE